MGYAQVAVRVEAGWDRTAPARAFTVVTSDPRDMRVVAEGKHVEVVTL